MHKDEPDPAHSTIRLPAASLLTIKDLDDWSESFSKTRLSINKRGQDPESMSPALGNQTQAKPYCANIIISSTSLGLS